MIFHLFEYQIDGFSLLLRCDAARAKWAQNGIQMDEVDLFVFHQANKYMINYIRKLMEIDKDRFYVFMESVGNTVSSTIPIALCEAEKEGRLKGNVVLAGFGVGLSYGAGLLRIGK